MTITLYQMDVMKALKQLPDESVDMQITSPPYWGLRSYGKEVEVDWGDGYIGELGLEPDFDLFIKHLCDIFDEVKRVLKKDGSCWVNLGDTYSSGNRGMNKEDKLAPGRMQENPPPNRLNCGLVDKCLCGIPERFMIEMINRGWILRNKIIWYKRNHMPTSVKDRFANSWEYLFFFSKSKKYYFDLDAVREAHQTHENRPMGIVRERTYGYDTQYPQVRSLKSGNPNIGQQQFHSQNINYSLKGKNPSDSWWLSPKYEKSEGHSNRQGLNRPLDTVTLKAYVEYQKPIAEYLKKWIKKEHKEKLNETFGQHKWTHWIRTDLSGASLPGAEDWWKLKEIIRFDEEFDDKIKEVTKLNIPVFQSGRNPSDFWDITTHGYPEAHFAVFPEALVEKPIKTTRKNAVIMDIFAGSGTTLKVARDLHRDSIGIEIKKEYIKLIEKRLWGGNKPLIQDAYKLIK